MAGMSLFRGVGVTAQPSLSLIIMSLNRFAGDLRSVREPLEVAVATVIHDRIADNFANQTAAGFESWEELAQRTQDEREAEGYGAERPILERTGKLRKEALRKKIWTFQGQQGIAFVRADAFTRAPYAAALNDGGTMWHGGTLKARPFLIINDADIEQIQEIIAGWIEQRIADRGLGAAGVAAGVLSRMGRVSV